MTTPATASRGSSKGRQAAQLANANLAGRAPKLTNYQAIIAAEFVLAELLIALTPMTSKKNPTDVSPYVPRDMTKMLAVGVTYFLLELLAVPAGWGRFCAWFGGLILLAVGVNEASNVAKDIDAFAGITTAVKKKLGESVNA